jgi:ribosomal protein S18 acetylase RimI-like enzyme
MSSVSRRSAVEEDDVFLLELFKAVRSPAFAIAPMPAAQIDLLMRIQYAAQKQSYSAQFPGSDHQLVLVDGNAAGRIWISRLPAEHRLVDIALLPAYQNRGIGALLVKEAIEEAGRAGVPLRCSVALSNGGSLRFHQRLGFRIMSQDEVYAELSAEPAKNGFERVSQLILSDSSLRDRLLEAADLPTLFGMVLAVGEERGYELQEQELQAIVNANRRSWFERWIDP